MVATAPPANVGATSLEMTCQSKKLYMGIWNVFELQINLRSV